jgi:hypothetical protein
MKIRIIAAVVAGIAIAAAPAVAAARPDLHVTSLVDPPSAMHVGDEFSSLARVTNSGTAKVGKSTTTRFYLTTDPRAAPRQYLLLSRTTHRLRPGGTTFVSLRVRIPQDIPSGNAYYLVACADATKLVRESNERNNCIVGVTEMVILPHR